MGVRRAGLAGLVLAALVAAAGCGSGGSDSSSSTSGGAGASTGGSASSGDPINVLSVTDTTGPLKLYGLAHLQGLESGAAYLNANGGIDGRRVVITHHSSNGDPSVAVSSLVRELSGNPDKYTFVDAGAESAEGAAMAAALTRYPVLAMTNNVGGRLCQSATRCPHEFVLLGSPKWPEVAAAEWIKDRGHRTVGILQQGAAFAEQATPLFEDELDTLGIRYKTLTFPSDTVDLTSQMSQLKSAGADVVYVEGIGPPAGYALAARAKLGWDVPVVFGNAASAIDITRLAPRAQLANSFETISRSQDAALRIPGIPLLKQYYDPQSAVATMPPINVAGMGWDEMMIFRQAAAQAGSLEADALTEALESPSDELLNDPNYVNSKQYGFGPDDHENAKASAENFLIIPTSPVVDGQNQAK